MNRKLLESDEASDLVQQVIEDFTIEDTSKAAAAWWSKIIGTTVEQVPGGIRVVLKPSDAEDVLRCQLQERLLDCYYDTEAIADLLNEIRPEYEAEAFDNEHCAVNDI